MDIGGTSRKGEEPNTEIGLPDMAMALTRFSIDRVNTTCRAMWIIEATRLNGHFSMKRY